MALRAEIAVRQNALAADGLYTYLVPEEFRAEAVPGAYVRVPFGRGTRTLEGVIFSVEEGDPVTVAVTSAVSGHPPGGPNLAIGNPINDSADTASGDPAGDPVNGGNLPGGTGEPAAKSPVPGAGDPADRADGFVKPANSPVPGAGDPGHPAGGSANPASGNPTGDSANPASGHPAGGPVSGGNLPGRTGEPAAKSPVPGAAGPADRADGFVKPANSPVPGAGDPGHPAGGPANPASGPAAEPFVLKEVEVVRGGEPILDGEGLLLARYLRERTYCSYGAALRQIAPPEYLSRRVYAANPDFTGFTGEPAADRLLRELRASPVKAKNLAGADRETVVALNTLLRLGAARQRGEYKPVRLASLNPDRPNSPLTQTQLKVVAALKGGDLPVRELCERAGVSGAVVTALREKGVLTVREAVPEDEPGEQNKASDPNEQGDPGKQNNPGGRDKTGEPGEQADPGKQSGSGKPGKRDKTGAPFSPPPLELTDEQEAAYRSLLADYRAGGRTSLLYGVTGSGKTKVYLKLLDTCLADGRTAIVTVPEIALTPQTLSIFSERYGDTVAVFHSALPDGERYRQWEKAKSGAAKIAVGTRSAVFAPLRNIGLIVVDEEQEACYKSELSPRFSAADVARFRAKYHGALLLLSSATPSVETFSRAKSGAYGLAVLRHRYGNAVLPDVVTVDMRREVAAGNTSLFSGKLLAEMTAALRDGRQAILLLNRRGYNTYVSCPSCGHVMTCDNCSISLTYHAAEHKLRCHYCGKSEPVTDTCPECGAPRLRYSGRGTEKAETELRGLFPEARIIRMDTDTTSTREDYERNIASFAAGKYDILVGTQMVAKGLDFPNVTLVGVLDADGALYSPDFRGFERAFSLLTQVVGRAGRGDAAGKAVIQTCDPDNGIIDYARRQDYDGFYSEEILTRRLMVYPPYCSLTVAYVTSRERAAAAGGADFLAKFIAGKLKGEFSGVKLITLGPVVCTVPKVKNEYRYRLIFKHRDNRETRSLFRRALDAFLAEKPLRAASLILDADPQNIQ